MELLESQLAELRRDLEGLARELQQVLEGSAEAARPVQLDQTAIGRVSRVDAIQQKEMLAANRQAQGVRLQGVRSALLRFEEGDYGDCLECGDGVGYPRLKARPETPFCITCQTARERT